MKILSLLRWCAILAVLGVLVFLVMKFKSSPDASNFKVQETLVSELKPALELCTVEIIEDVPIKGHVGTKHIFARTTLTGNISFSLDCITTIAKGDTLIVNLPPEIVEIHESTLPGSYEIIDTWNEKLFGTSKFTTAEENAIKRKVAQNFRKKIYTKGYIRRAREEATSTLNQMLNAISPTPVTVVDPSPDGYPTF